MSSKPALPSTLLRLPDGVEVELVIVRMDDGVLIVRTPAELEADEKAGRLPFNPKAPR